MKALYRLICVSLRVGAYLFLVDRNFRKHLSISEREGYIEASHHHNLAITLTAVIRMICLVSVFACNLRKSDSEMCGDRLSVFEDPGTHTRIDEDFIATLLDGQLLDDIKNGTCSNDGLAIIIAATFQFRKHEL